MWPFENFFDAGLPSRMAALSTQKSRGSEIQKLVVFDSKERELDCICNWAVIAETWVVLAIFTNIYIEMNIWNVYQKAYC